MMLRTRQRGYVLLMVLLVLTIAATAVTAIVRRSCKQALLANRAQRELQRRWGCASCEEFFLPRAEEILLSRADASQGSPSSFAHLLTVGGLRYQVLLSDEQAKANVNWLVHTRGRSRAADALRELQRELSRPLPVELAPMNVRTPADPLELPVRCATFDQVFTVDHPSDLVDLVQPSRSPTGGITCWGDGKVNFKRARVAVLRIVLEGVLTHGQVADLAALAAERPDCALDEAIESLDLGPRTHDQVHNILTDLSACHSVWVVCEDDARKWYRFTVARALRDGTGSPRRAQRRTLAW